MSALGAEPEAVCAGQEDRRDLPLPEEKLQQYTPLVPGKVLYICRWGAPLPAALSCIPTVDACACWVAQAAVCLAI